MITAAADDFGHIVHRVPAAVARPRQPGEVAALVRCAVSAGLRVQARGGGHSVAGQAQCDGGIVCDLTALDEVTITGPSQVSAGAGARWSAILAAALEHGLTPSVLTDYLELTVGGTLSAGGIGGTSHQHGPQADLVDELEVVTADGEVVTCSPTSRPDVFTGALAGQGREGIITRSKIPLVPAPERARVFRIRFADLETLIGAQRRLARERRFDYLEGQILPGSGRRWTYIAEAAVFYIEATRSEEALLDGLSISASETETEDVEYLTFCHRMIPGVRLLAETGQWYQQHPWFSVFLPAATTGRFVTGALAMLTPATLGELPMLLYPMRRGRFPAPGLATPATGMDGLFYTFSILRTTVGPATDDAREQNQALARAAVEAGGTVYSISVT